MKILIIGGTRFLGRHLVESALARGHEVTLFNRGKTNPDLFKQVQTISGDREKDLDQISGAYDVVIDTCGYMSPVVRMSAEALKDKVKTYVFISSISVYSDFSKIGINENDAVATLEDGAVEESTPETYGPRKALCEKAAQDVFGNNTLIIRPGLIVGPHDPTDRFTYWPVRIARGGDVLVPDRPAALTQVIDVRDLSSFIIHLLEQNVSGIFNATGPAITLEKFFETCKQVSGSDAHLRWASAEFIEENKVAAWSELPAWLPDNGEDAGFASVDISKAIKSGLKFSQFAETVEATLAWASQWPADYEMKAGLKPEREKELLRLLDVQ